MVEIHTPVGCVGGGEGTACKGYQGQSCPLLLTYLGQSRYRGKCRPQDVWHIKNMLYMGVWAWGREGVWQVGTVGERPKGGHLGGGGKHRWHWLYSGRGNISNATNTHTRSHFKMWHSNLHFFHTSKDEGTGAEDRCHSDVGNVLCDVWQVVTSHRTLCTVPH